MPVHNHILQWENTGCLLTAVFERYGKNGNIGLGFITGNCHKKGAVATTYAHDNHNLLVAGSNIDDILIAINRVIALQGGFLVVENGEVLAELQLNVGGILSDKSVTYAGTQLEAVRSAMKSLGYQHYNPIMSFGVLTLTVSPALKITDKGLIDVTKSAVVSLFP